MSKMQKVWLWVFLGMFILPEVLWGGLLSSFLNLKPVFNPVACRASTPPPVVGVNKDPHKTVPCGDSGFEHFLSFRFKPEYISTRVRPEEFVHHLEELCIRHTVPFQS